MMLVETWNWGGEQLPERPWRDALSAHEAAINLFAECSEGGLYADNLPPPWDEAKAMGELSEARLAIK